MSLTTAILLSLSILFPLIAGLIIKKKSVLLKKFINFLLVGTITEIALVITAFIGNNLIIFNIYSLIELVLIYLIYHELIKNSMIKNIISFFCLLIIASGILSFKFSVIDSKLKFYESLFVIICGLLYFFLKSKKENISIGLYLLNSGLVLFFSCNVFIYLVSEHLIHVNKEYYSYLYGLHSYINCGVNFIYFIAIILLKRNEMVVDKFKKINSLKENILRSNKEDIDGQV